MIVMRSAWGPAAAVNVWLLHKISHVYFNYMRFVVVVVVVV